jgi:hypothetical protein
MVQDLKAERDFVSTGYLDEGNPFVQLFCIELLITSSQLYRWAVK